MSDKKKKTLSAVMIFILLMGIVSLFSDMTHEGGRSVLGKYLNMTGASAATIGFISGLGELLGYGLRIISGRIADKHKNYWTLVIIGYVIQVLAIPALALVPENGWIFACGLVLIERLGKAIKKPAKNTLVSFAASKVGQGKGFALMEFLDQLGAFLGPFIVFGVCYFKGTENLFGTYHLSFAILGIPALITIALVVMSRFLFPHPETFEKAKDDEEKFRFKKSFVFYMIAICLFAFGFVDFTLITLHSANSGVIPEEYLSLLYAGAMVIDAFAALFFGWLFDKIGMKALMISTLLCSAFGFLVFLTDKPALMIAGIAIWGIGMGAQESIMKAAVSQIIPRNMRSTGFGIFETGFGIFWFLGSWIMGILYDVNTVVMVVVSAATMLSAIAFYYISVKTDER